jgi:hypothetical protein
MNRTRVFSSLAFGLVLGVFPALAQTPLFLDGTALGGSKVFSAGISPLGNPARYDQPEPGIYATFIDGDQRSLDNKSVLEELGVNGAPTAVSGDDLRQLAASPWALRTQSFALAYLSKTGNTSFSHEDFNSVLAATDGTTMGQTTLNDRHSTVDRAAVGIGSMQQGTALGFSLRLERWKMGSQNLFLNPTGSQLPLSGGPDPFAFDDMPEKTTTFAVDFGFIYEPMQGLRFGGTIDRLNQKHLWDVYEKPQARVGVQLDIGRAAKLGLEMDVNAAQRMPFPVNQRTAAASLQFGNPSSMTISVGLERKKIGDATRLSGSLSAQFHAKALLVGLGFQVTQDSPLKGLMMMVN